MTVPRRRWSAGALTLALAGSLLAGAPSPAAATGGPSEHQQDLAAARAATAEYHNVQKALDDGYAEDPHCVAVPGLGTMGHHYVNIDNLNSTDPEEPFALLYAPRRDGTLRLVAVEYLVTSASTGGSRPSMFGVDFNGPMDEHVPNTTGRHYDLHVWAWAHNPEGMFAQFNPSLSC